MLLATCLSAWCRAVASLTVQGRQDFNFHVFPEISIKFPYVSSFFNKFLSIFSSFASNFFHLPHFGPSDGQPAHPGRPWLCHWLGIMSLFLFSELDDNVVWKEGNQTISLPTVFEVPVLIFGNLQGFYYSEPVDVGFLIQDAFTFTSTQVCYKLKLNKKNTQRMKTK